MNDDAGGCAPWTPDRNLQKNVRAEHLRKCPGARGEPLNLPQKFGLMQGLM